MGWLQRGSLNWNLLSDQFVFFQNKCVGYNQSGLFYSRAEQHVFDNTFKSTRKGECLWSNWRAGQEGRVCFSWGILDVEVPRLQQRPGAAALSRCLTPECSQGLQEAHGDSSADPFLHVGKNPAEHVFSDCIHFLKAREIILYLGLLQLFKGMY